MCRAKADQCESKKSVHDAAVTPEVTVAKSDDIQEFDADLANLGSSLPGISNMAHLLTKPFEPGDEEHYIAGFPLSTGRLIRGCGGLMQQSAAEGDGNIIGMGLQSVQDIVSLGNALKKENDSDEEIDPVRTIFGSEDWKANVVISMSYLPIPLFQLEHILNIFLCLIILSFLFNFPIGNLVLAVDIERQV